MLVAWVLYVGRTLYKTVLAKHFLVSPSHHYNSKKPHKFACNEVTITLWNVQPISSFIMYKLQMISLSSLRIMLTVSQCRQQIPSTSVFFSSTKYSLVLSSIRVFPLPFLYSSSVPTCRKGKQYFAWIILPFSL